MWAYTNEENDYLSFFGEGPRVATRAGPSSTRFNFKRVFGINRFRLAAWSRGRSRREAARAELYALDSRTLSDLGINSGDFPAILAGTFNRSDQSPDALAAPRGQLASRTLAMPSDANPSGAVFGGWVMALMDSSGAMTATKIADGRVVTVSVSEITFLKPLRVGDSVCCYTDLLRVGGTSLTLGVEVWVLREGRGERIKVTHAEFTFVAVDDHGKPRSLPRHADRSR